MLRERARRAWAASAFDGLTDRDKNLVLAVAENLANRRQAAEGGQETGSAPAEDHEPDTGEN
jgi:hypothetical protein